MVDGIQPQPQPEPVPAWVPETIKKSRNALILAVIVGGASLLFVLWLVDTLGDVLRILGTALFLAVAMDPAATWFANRGWRRGAATGLIFVMLIIAVVLLIAMIVPAVISGFNQLIDNAPELVDKLARWLKPLGVDLSTDKIVTELQSNSEQVVQQASQIAGGLFGIATSLLGGIFRWATIGLFTFYMVAEGPKMRRAVLSRFPPERQERMLFVFEKAIEQTGAYFYSRLLLAIINGTGMYLVLRLTNVPFAAPLAIFGGLVSEFIPIVGTYIGGAIPILVAFLTGLGPGLWALGYVLVYQQIENYILSPRLTAKTMSLHPAVAFGAVLVGGAIGGFLVAFLSLPVAGVIQAMIKEYGKSYEVVEVELTEMPTGRPEKEKKLRKRVRSTIARRRSNDGEPDE
jgi:predicted PurR-regulated permease PerM